MLGFWARIPAAAFIYVGILISIVQMMAEGRWTWKGTFVSGGAERVIWFLGMVLMVLLVQEGAEVNPGPLVKQNKND
jgi:hypothetical protein